MIDRITYDSCSQPLEQKMFELEALLRDFFQALQMCSGSPDREFLRQAQVLATELAGQPGDAALEIYRDLERDLSHTSSFVQRWGAAETGPAAPVFHAACRLRDGLEQLQNLVESTPPEVMREIKSRISKQRTTQAFGPGKMLLPILGPLAAILAYQQFGLWGMIVVAWVALILFFKMR